MFAMKVSSTEIEGPLPGVDLDLRLMPGADGPLQILRLLTVFDFHEQRVETGAGQFVEGGAPFSCAVQPLRVVHPDAAQFAHARRLSPGSRNFDAAPGDKSLLQRFSKSTLGQETFRLHTCRIRFFEGRVHLTALLWRG
jgi:hypothetical protein